MEDPVTVENVARMASEDEEMDAEVSARICVESPLVMLARDVSQSVASGKLGADVLILGCGATALTLLAEVLPGRQMIASLGWRNTNFQGNCASPVTSVQSAFCFGAPLTDGVTPAAVIPCSLECPNRQAIAFSRSVFNHIKPQLIIILGDLPSQSYHGPGDPSQEEVQVVLQTDVARQAVPKLSIPYLAAGDLVTGVPAALITAAQARHMRGTLVVRVCDGEHVTQEAVQCFGAALSTVLEAHGKTELQGMLDVNGAVTRACTGLMQRQLQHQAASSMYL